ncbi:hypothetical protein ILYODFUR_013267 [Ilyodon furcidens]|uniref:Uncharacterized protein n=1 Tax=Ilyodon furcidens TaxID=33524 RepID=A0ABV0TW04_9TELE
MPQITNVLPCCTVIQADWQFVYSGQIQNGCLVQERRPASLITRKSYTERIKQGYNRGDGSFQSNRGANQRVGVWQLCAPRNRWKQSGLTQAEVSVKPESWLRMD